MTMGEWAACVPLILVRDMILEANKQGRTAFLVLLPDDFCYVFAARFAVNDGRLTFYVRSIKNQDEKMQTVVIAEFNEWASAWNLHEIVRQLEWQSAKIAPIVKRKMEAT